MFSYYIPCLVQKEEVLRKKFEALITLAKLDPNRVYIIFENWLWNVKILLLAVKSVNYPIFKALKYRVDIKITSFDVDMKLLVPERPPFFVLQSHLQVFEILLFEYFTKYKKAFVELAIKLSSHYLHQLNYFLIEIVNVYVKPVTLLQVPP